MVRVLFIYFSFSFFFYFVFIYLLLLSFDILSMYIRAHLYTEIQYNYMNTVYTYTWSTRFWWTVEAAPQCLFTFSWCSEASIIWNMRFFRFKNSDCMAETLLLKRKYVLKIFFSHTRYLDNSCRAMVFSLCVCVSLCISCFWKCHFCLKHWKRS